MLRSRERYFVDLYFDDVVINRWTGITLARGGGASLIDWTNLSANVIPTPGVHVLKLVLDSTNLIEEADETDNTYELEVVWEEGRPRSRAREAGHPSARPCRRATARRVRCYRGESVCRRR